MDHTEDTHTMTQPRQSTPAVSQSAPPSSDRAVESSVVRNDDSKLRGFAAMDKDKQQELARRGGKSAHARGTAHQFNADEAREAGRKGGRSVSQDREYMSRIGREGAKKSAAVRSKRASST